MRLSAMCAGEGGRLQICPPVRAKSDTVPLSAAVGAAHVARGAARAPDSGGGGGAGERIPTANGGGRPGSAPRPGRYAFHPKGMVALRSLAHHVSVGQLLVLTYEEGHQGNQRPPSVAESQRVRIEYRTQLRRAK